MKSDSDAAYEARANIGVGASLGAVLGAIVAELLTDDSLLVIAASLLGAGLGAAVGSRSRSQMPQFLWIEYPPRIGRMIVLSSLPFFALFSASIYAIKREAAGELQIILLLATAAVSIPLFLAVGRVIGQLDDLLKKVQAWLVGRLVVARRYR